MFALVFSVDLSALQGPAAGMKRFDTGYGFSLDVPVTLERGPQTGNARLVFASASEDFTVIVANFGARQQDAASAGGV